MRTKAALNHKSGTVVHVHITAVRHTQNPTALTCILENQTALVVAEERLKQAADRLRNIVPSEGEGEQLSLEMMLEVVPVLVERHRALFELCMVSPRSYLPSLLLVNQILEKSQRVLLQDRGLS